MRVRLCRFCFDRLVAEEQYRAWFSFGWCWSHTIVEAEHPSSRLRRLVLWPVVYFTSDFKDIAALAIRNGLRSPGLFARDPACCGKEGLLPYKRNAPHISMRICEGRFFCKIIFLSELCGQCLSSNMFHFFCRCVFPWNWGPFSISLYWKKYYLPSRDSYGSYE